MSENFIFFFFKQKTAYEMLSGDWSSDVCSSDLRRHSTSPPGESSAYGRITARDPATGKLAWEKRYEIIPHSALLSTAGGLLFVGTTDGWVEALDAKSGDMLWHFNNGTGHNGGIVSYSVDGKQYIAVAIGHGSYVGRALADHYFKDKLINLKESAAVIVLAL